MKSVQILRNKGYSLRLEEEALLTRLKSMEKDLSKPAVFRGRINEIYTHVQQVRESKKLAVGNSDEGYTLTDPNALKPIVKALGEMGNGLKQLTMVISEDEATLETIQRRYQE